MTRIVALALVGLVAAACGDELETLRPMIDVPASDSDGYPLDTIDELELSIAESGAAEALQLARAGVDEPPTLSSVPYGDDLVLHLSGKAAGVELAYGRSCAFAMPDAAADELHLYFSRIVKWGPTSDPLDEKSDPVEPARTGGYGYAIGDGRRAVFLGGDGVEAVEVFDALTSGQFGAFPAAIQPTRHAAVFAPLGDGRVLLVGGVDAADAYIDRALLVDPTGTNLQLDADRAGPRLIGHAAAMLVDDTVLVAGGRGPDGVTGEAWRFRAVVGGGLDTAEVLFSSLVAARADHTMTRLGGELGANVLVVGGRDDADQPIAQAELYSRLRDGFEIVEDALLIAPRWGHSAVRMPGGFVLILGGYDPAPVTKLELYDPVLGVFLDVGEMPVAAGLNGLTVTPLRDGRVLLAGGVDATGAPVASTHIARLDPIDGRVVVAATDAMDVARSGHSAVELCDGTILVVGGTDDATFAERYNPPSTNRR